MPCTFWVIFLLIINLVYNYNYFNELRQDMQNKVQILAKVIEENYKNICEQKQIKCEVQSFNLCQGTDQRTCLGKFPSQFGCNGNGFFSIKSAVRIPNSFTSITMSEELKYFICETAKPEFQDILAEQALDNQGIHGWVYFGSQTGAIRVTPAFKYQKEENTESCKNYDCRLRYWYTQSVYQRKKIIILVENSKRIFQQPSRYQTIKLSIKTLLKTSQKGDYINIIEFSQTPRPLFSQSQLKLVQLRELINNYEDSLNLNKSTTFIKQQQFFQTVVNNISESNSSQIDYKEALQLAMTIINNSRNDNPEYQNLIIMFSAFKPSQYTENTFQELHSLLKQKQNQIKLNILFFGFGVKMIQIEAKQLMRKLSCSFNGIFIEIQDVIYESMFLDQAKSYYDYLIQNNQINYTRWTEFYDDQWGLGKLTTVTRGAYYNEKGITKLIGVAGIDIPLQKLLIYKSEYLIKKLLQVTQVPFRKNISTCALQTLRGNSRCSNNCLQYKLCEPKIITDDIAIMKPPIDKTNNHCCPFMMKKSETSLILGLVLGIGAFLLMILLGYYFVFYRRRNSHLDLTYGDIFKKFKNFDHTRIRSDSQISIIKQ